MLPHIFIRADLPCVAVRISPSARRLELRGLYGEKLKVSVSAPPEKDRANKQLEDALVSWLGLPRGGASIMAGHTSRDKVVGFTGLDEAELRARLKALLEEHGRNKKETASGSQGS